MGSQFVSSAVVHGDSLPEPAHSSTAFRLSAGRSTMAGMDEFEAELWLWEAQEAAWVFASVPADLSEDLRATAPPRGFGSVRVEVTLGGTTWRTSVFPDAKRGCFVLPVKKAVRTSETVEVGDTVTIGIRPVE